MEIKCSTCNEMHEAHPLLDKTGYVTVCPKDSLCTVHSCGIYNFQYTLDKVYTSGVFVGFEKDLKNFLSKYENTYFTRTKLACSVTDLLTLVEGKMI